MYKCVYLLSLLSGSSYPATCLVYCDIYCVLLPGNMGQCFLPTVCGLNPHSKCSDTSTLWFYL